MMMTRLLVAALGVGESGRGPAPNGGVGVVE